CIFNREWEWNNIWRTRSFYFNTAVKNPSMFPTIFPSFEVCTVTAPNNFCKILIAHLWAHLTSSSAAAPCYTNGFFNKTERVRLTKTTGCDKVRRCFRLRYGYFYRVIPCAKL